MAPASRERPKKPCEAVVARVGVVRHHVREGVEEHARRTLALGLGLGSGLGLGLGLG